MKKVGNIMMSISKHISGKGQSPKFLDHATTIWLASESSKPNTNNGLVPFGWVVMEIL